mmetsp:Transcript_15695/g.26966  ORF Transcript_15695/g.26966 Transcript_15695/m.26966 type:complete len:295 (-) Transcript_15695:31-915(-)|eukprot:CAMPEP_0168591784 /NCGR_PEP_ID=MMETSP0420-20121227/7330_1 /TAXON_ID=498008 /ORGANISM="Pessonella sp." /LENGTH=294 /DNA_ID=CAMNT_0008627621 /DNA_START=209 /DNA_END=1093 /DNA_ORIENTATION=+
MPTFYKDIGKNGKDLLNKDFPQNFDLVVETSPQKEGDVTIDAKLEAKRANDGSVSGSIKETFKHTSSGATLAATIFTSKKLELELSAKDKGVQGLKSKLKVTTAEFDRIKEKEQNSVRVEFEYTNDRVAATLGVDVLDQKPAAKVSAVTNKDNWTAGVDGTYSLGQNGELSKFGVIVGYLGVGWEATLNRLAGKGFNQDVSYAATLYQKIDANLQLAAAFDVQTGDDKANPNLKIGGKYQGLDSDVKATIGTNGRVGVAYTQTVNYFSKVTLGLDVNTADTKDHKLGLKLNISK